MKSKKIRFIVLLLVVIFVLSFASTAFAANFSVVRNGSRGNHVLFCQWMMYTDLSNVALSTVDGISGNTTTANIKRFQTLHGLNGDGVCGSGTWGKASSHMYMGNSQYPISFTQGCGRQTSLRVTRSFDYDWSNSSIFYTITRGDWSNGGAPRLRIPNA